MAKNKNIVVPVGGVGGTLFINAQRDRVRCKILRGMRRYLPTVLARNSPGATAAALTSMFSVALRALCGITTFKDTPAFQAHARVVLPGVASLLLSRELDVRGDLRGDERDALRTAFKLLNERRGWTVEGNVISDDGDRLWTANGWSIEMEPKGPDAAPSRPSGFAVGLSCQLDRTAAAIICEWAADCIHKRLTEPPGQHPDSIDLEVIEILLGGCRRIDRKEQYDAWSEYQDRIGYSVTVARFCKAAKISHSAFYSKWYGYVWLDSDPEGERILGLLSRSWTNFPR